jgi:hypothetical protein
VQENVSSYVLIPNRVRCANRLSTKTVSPLIVGRGEKGHGDTGPRGRNRLTNISFSNHASSEEEETSIPSNRSKSSQSKSLLDFGPEQVSLSMVSLHSDLESQISSENLFAFYRSWIAHSIISARSKGQSHAAEAIERVIEIACCLELLCQRHDLAILVVRALDLEAVSRLKAWRLVRTGLIPKPEEIRTRSLSKGLRPDTPVFQAPRNKFVERWILSRPYLDERDLLSESLRLEPPSGGFRDVDDRLSKLEAIVKELDKSSQQEATSSTTFAETKHSPTSLAAIDSFSNSDAEFSDVSESELEDSGAGGLDDLARKIAERVALQLHTLVDGIKSRAKDLSAFDGNVSPTSCSQGGQHNILRTPNHRSIFEGIVSLKPIK